MPSVSAMIVPTSRASAFASKFWIRCRIRSLISEAFIAMFSVLANCGRALYAPSASSADHRARELLEPRAHRAVDHHVIGLNDRAADQRRIDFELELDVAPEALLEPLLHALHDARVDGDRGDELRLDLVLGLGFQRVELRRDLGQHCEPVVLDEQREQTLALRALEELRALEADADRADELRALGLIERRVRERAP